MRQIIKDWCNFCENGTKFEDGHFYTLFMDGPSPDEIKEVFKYFDQKSELTDRMVKYLYDPRPQIGEGEELKDELRKLIVKDFEDRKKLLLQLDCFKKFLSNPEFVFMSDLEHNEALIWDDIWSQRFVDFMIDNVINEEEKTYIIFDSFYGITFDFNLQIYLFIPFVKTDYTAKHLFSFKRLGGIYAISDNIVYYSFKS